MKSIFWRFFLYFSFFCVCIFAITISTVALTSDFRPPPPPDLHFLHQTNIILKLCETIIEKSDENEFQSKLKLLSNDLESWGLYNEENLPKKLKEHFSSKPDKLSYFSIDEHKDSLVRKFYYSNNKIGFIYQTKPTNKGFVETFSSGKLFVIRFLIVLSVAVFLCYRFSLTIVNPLINLRDTYSKFGTQNLSARPEASLISRKDEIGDLARDFSRMAENLEFLINSQQKLFHEISHEFKSPLTRLQLSIESIEINDSETYSEEIDRIKLECYRIRSLIDQILSVAKIDSGFTGPEESFRIDYLIDDLLSNLEIEAQNKNITFSFTNECEHLCTSYPLLFKRACENILRNSIKYSPQNSKIEIILEFINKLPTPCFKLVFKDQGSGMSVEKIAQIAEATKSNTKTLAYVGSGFGLAIVFRIINKLGGTIVLKNLPGSGLEAEIQISQ